jgi:hypothetical protein
MVAGIFTDVLVENEVLCGRFEILCNGLAMSMVDEEVVFEEEMSLEDVNARREEVESVDLNIFQTSAVASSSLSTRCHSSSYAEACKQSPR